MNAEISLYQAGDTNAQWIPGDFVLTRNLAPWYSKSGWVSAAIRLGERLALWRAHVPKDQRKYLARWSHAVAVSLPDGGGPAHLVEAAGRGVIVSPTDKYTPQEYLYVHTDLTLAERMDACGYWERMVGTSYGYLTIVSIAITCITGLRVAFNRPDQVICSGLVCAGLGIWEYRGDPAFTRPDQLAQYHGIKGSP